MGSLWNRSGMVERYGDDLRASGAKAYFFSGGTTTPLSVYEDAGEAAAHDHPVVADTNGRWPDVFVPYVTSYDVRVTTANGVQLTYTQEIPNPSPVDLSTTTPAANTVTTGMIHAEFIDAVKTGYVRLNARTIGNASSVATERAHADTSDLFVYLWNNMTDALAAVSGGRGGTAAADYAANKTITLPDMRGHCFMGLDTMGNTTSFAFVGAVWQNGSEILPGSRTGKNLKILSTAEMPAHTHTASSAANLDHFHIGTSDGQNQSHTHSGTTSSDGGHTHTASSSSSGAHTHTINQSNNTLGGLSPAPTSGSVTVTTNYATSSDGAHTHTITVDSVAAHNHTFSTGSASQDHTHTFTTNSTGAHTHDITVDSSGSSTPFMNMPFTLIVTWFIKL